MDRWIDGVMDCGVMDYWRAGNQLNSLTIKVTIPERIADYDPTGATVAFETAIDDHAEIRVDGELSRALGQKAAR
jgi:hypothetical protein